MTAVGAGRGLLSSLRPQGVATAVPPAVAPHRGQDSLRILHLAEAFGGGLMEMVLALAAGSADHGHEVLIAHGVRPETPDDLRARVDDRVELHPLGWTRRTPGAQLRALQEVRALIRDWEPDLVHLHSSFAAVLGAVAIKDRIPTVWSPNAYASALPEAGRFRRAVLRSAERAASRRIDIVGAVSASEADLAWSLGAQTVMRVHNGIRELDPELVRTGGSGAVAADFPRIVATGRTVPQRQPEACARILAAVREYADVEWLGGGGGRRGLAGARALTDEGIAPSGWLPRQEILKRVESATAYLHWTAWDGLPLSILEALALDVVVIASDIAPNREILGPESVFRTEDEAVEALRRIVAEPDYAEHLRGLQRARRELFSAERMVSGWHKLYARLHQGEHVLQPAVA